MRVIVTGSRYYADAELIRSELKSRYIQAGLEKSLPLIVVDGGAAGADYHARVWAEQMEDLGFWVRRETHLADWKTHGRAAGPRRNAEMVKSGANEVLAFYQHGAANIGTEGCCKLAKAAGILTTKYI